MQVIRRLVFALFTLALCSLSVAARPAVRDAINEPGEDWHATFGPELQRGTASAEFTLRDAKGNELEAAELRDLQLHRKVGAWWEKADARFSGSKVLCDGLASLGLDAGSYELELDLGVYGKLQHPFELKPGEQLKGELKTEVWRRIICFKFVDAKGVALPWLPAMPSYTAVRPANEFSKREIPPRILRDPPSNGGGRGGSGGFAYRRARGGGGRVLTPRYDTDAGRWHLRVFAGASGTIICPLNEELLGKSELKIEDDFTQAQWDEHRVELAPTEAYVEATENRKALNAADPGAKSINSLAVNPAAPTIDFNDETTLSEGWWRVVLKPDPALCITPVHTNVRSKGGSPSPSTTPIRKQGDVFITEVSGSDVVYFTWKSPVVAFEEGRTFAVTRNRLITTVEPIFNLIPVKISWPSETARALTLAVGAWVTPQAYTSGHPHGFKAQEFITVHFERSYLESMKDDRFFSCRLLTKPVLSELSYTNFTAPYGVCQLKPEIRQLLLKGTATAPMEWSGLLWRAVNSQNQPLPWVEASLMTSDQATVALNIRKCWQKVRRAKKTENENYTPDFDAELAAVAEKLPDRAFQNYLEATGAWYESRRKATDLGCGYAGFGGELKPGQRYTLFLWSNSRDELKPDKRIDFVAGKGITDLGVIVLPAYR